MMPDEAMAAAPIRVPQRDLEDLRQRLSRTRWPDPEQVSDRSQGVPRDRQRWRTLGAALWQDVRDGSPDLFIAEVRAIRFA